REGGRGALRAGLAAARTAAHAGGTLRAAAASCRARLRCGRARRPARRQDPQRATPVPIVGRPRARRLRLGGGPGTAAQPLTARLPSLRLCRAIVQLPFLPYYYRVEAFRRA